MKSVHHSIIGLPRSGKTTFLAALWHILDAGEVHTKLVLDKLSGDYHYLNSIVDAWRRCEEVPRTSIASEANISIHARELATGRLIILAFPDLSGESFDQQVITRTCSQAYVEMLNGSAGILLFITADRGQDGIGIIDIDADPGEATKPNEPPQPHGWTHQMVPEQVRLVELLQFMTQPPFEPRRRRLAVIVSAWDVVVRRELQPEQWLADELPLLFQFLKSSSEYFEVRVYGVSAQGGDVTSSLRRDLLDMTPSERVSCVGHDTDRNDLTSPIVWLTSER